MKTFIKLFGVLILLVGLGSCEKDEFDSMELSAEETDEHKRGRYDVLTDSYSPAVVIQWYELISQSIDNRVSLAVEAKIYAMTTLAMHDALNNVVPKYETYALNNSRVDMRGVTKKNVQSMADAAVSQAARDMLVQLYPSATVAADDLLSRILSEIKDSDYKKGGKHNLHISGIQIGQEAAAAVLSKRANDFQLAFATHVGSTAPGQHQSDYMPWMVANPPVWPDNAVFAPNMGSLTPFGIKSGAQFTDVAPYPLNSAEYLADYNEVKELGCNNCPLRTDEQTQIGAFWIESVSSSMNRLARALIVQRELNGWEAARLVGLIQMSQIDAWIASFDGKYHFNFWRPITAIRAGNSDGVEATEGDASWTPTFTIYQPFMAPTPPTPEFPSTHAYNAGAAAAVFKSFFRTDYIDLNLTSPYYLPGIERNFSSFSQMAFENAVSRIYIGYHFRNAVEVGNRQGRELGNYVYGNNLRELKKVL
ncbi:vanadium-dependent haloperoxidase [Pontibacter roseus]|uniref:vanadium-dependent haloperoxidase n=1 Tax=Pontibacter roseus TaxID=336989 RepID=UPI0003678420|nr:vanadium-dependent haloperoxidase [Pontibacter roseus]